MDAPGEEEARFLDMRIKEKEATMRTVFGEDKREASYWPARPSFRVVSSQSEYMAKGVAHYESAMGLYLKGWIDPIKEQKWQRLIPGDWKTVMLNRINCREQARDVYDLTSDNPQWRIVRQVEPAKLEDVEDLEDKYVKKEECWQDIHSESNQLRGKRASRSVSPEQNGFASPPAKRRRLSTLRNQSRSLERGDVLETSEEELEEDVQWSEDREPNVLNIEEMNTYGYAPTLRGPRVPDYVNTGPPNYL